MGHAGMSPRQNFGRGGGKAKKGPHKNNTPTWRKKVAERLLKGGKKPSQQEKRSKKASTWRKKAFKR